jgi:isocitrate lyase
LLARLHRPAEDDLDQEAFRTTERRYLYLSGWMIAALRSEFGPLPDQSMHEKTSVPR